MSSLFFKKNEIMQDVRKHKKCSVGCHVASLCVFKDLPPCLCPLYAGLPRHLSDKILCFPLQESGSGPMFMIPPGPDPGTRITPPARTTATSCHLLRRPSSVFAPVHSDQPVEHPSPDLKRPEAHAQVFKYLCCGRTQSHIRPVALR